MAYSEEQKSLSAKYQQTSSNKIPKSLIYIPFINLIFLFKKDTKYTYHIRNACTLSLLLFIAIILDITGNISSNIYILFIIPFLFGI
jgi:hypothetical protein